MKFFSWFSNNILFVFTLFLLAFIPLYPKLPVFGVQHTWVYIRIEDFLVALSVIVLVIQIIRKKAEFKSPLTIPIIIFWIIGAISTLFAIFFIFPHLLNVFPNVAFFSYIRHIEYLSLFFVAYASMKDKRFIPIVTVVIAITLLLVVAYGVGQRFYGFPAYLTMNEEFAKGIPLRLSSSARIPSTFAGHYDLAAYLVLIIPLLGSMIFGFKNIFIKIILFLSCASGVVLILMTASRVSFVVYLFAVGFMLLLQKKKLFFIPVLVLSILLLHSFQGASQRFNGTISQVDLVVDARTGKAIGIAKKADESAVVDKTPKSKTNLIPTPIVIEDVQSTGENLPQGSGYINLPSQNTQQTSTQIVYKRTQLKVGTQSAQVTNIEGDFVVKKVLAYDVSFTTRFQGEWPRAIDAFKRNILLGSGYSSISLASDNNYLRALGETGLFGFGSFLLLFLVFGIYMRNVLPTIQSTASRSFVIGTAAGLFGLGLNAILIDVFEASKVAFVLWIFMGLSTGILRIYQQATIDFIKELKKTCVSTPAILLGFLIASFLVFSSMLNNFFVGDDFTWLRWAADCKKILYTTGLKCEPFKETLLHMFTNSDGFFYRPGTKIYFYGMYSIFSLNPGAYHVMSILIHFITTGFVFLLSKKFLRSNFFAILTAFSFLVLVSHAESIFWISATGHLIASAAILSGLYFYIRWKENKKPFIFFVSLISLLIAPLFYELGIVGPALVVFYDFIRDPIRNWGFVKRWYDGVYLLIIPLYVSARMLAKSHWFSGDYSYRLSALVFNIVGNSIGYIGITLFGTKSLFYIDQLRAWGKHNGSTAFIAVVVFLFMLVFLYRFLLRNIKKEDKQIIFISLILFILPLVIFLGLGNVTLRYVYLATFGVLLFLFYALQKISRVFGHKQYLSTIIIGSIVLLFWAYNINNLRSANNDWQKSGDITSNMLVTFNQNFTKTPLIPNPVFYFADVPIRYGQAWTFPVGLPDALWFTFQNENLTVHVKKSIDVALDEAEGSASAKVFQFTKDGGVEEIIRTKTIVPVHAQ